MTVGNLIALRQITSSRMLAYSRASPRPATCSPPLAVPGDPKTSLTAVVVCLIISAAMNLGAFAVVILVARKTRSAEIKSFGGLTEYALGLAVTMTIFLLFSLAASRRPSPAGSGSSLDLPGGARGLAPRAVGSILLAIAIANLNSVIVARHYANVAQEMRMNPKCDCPTGTRPASGAAGLAEMAALAIATVARRRRGHRPASTHFGDVVSLASGGGSATTPACAVHGRFDAFVERASATPGAGFAGGGQARPARRLHGNQPECRAAVRGSGNPDPRHLVARYRRAGSRLHRGGGREPGPAHPRRTVWQRHRLRGCCPV